MLTKVIRPYVILNVAATADGKTDSVDREGASISSIEDIERVDRLRAEVNGIMVGGRTLLENDPRLTVKSVKLQEERKQLGMDSNPVKIGVVTKADLRPGSRFLGYGPARKLIFTTKQSELEQVEQLEKQGARVYIMGEERVELSCVMEQLWREEVRKLLVEGGGTLNDELLRLGYVDEIYLFIAPKIFGGSRAPTFVDGQGFGRENGVELQLIDVQNMAGGGVLIHYRPIYDMEETSTIKS